MTSTLNNITSWLTGRKDQMKRWWNKDFALGTMAMCALVAYADGKCTSDEKSKTAKAINASELLKGYDVSELKGAFDDACAKLDSDFDFGKADCIMAIAKAKSDPDKAGAIIRIGIAIGNADGDFDAKERAIVAEVCRELRLNPDDFNV